MALESSHITATAIAAIEYPDLVQQFRVTGVPKTVVNDRVEILGAVPEAEFVGQVLAPPTAAV
jgi:predicted DsbA family dithiol-disulfide isomerase